MPTKDFTNSLQSQRALRLFCRMAGYTAALVGVLVGLHELALTAAGIGMFKEGGFVELIQLLLIAATAVLLAAAARRFTAYRSFLMLLALLAAIAVVREMDSLMKVWIPGLGWKAPALVIVGGVAVLVLRRSATIFRAAMRLVNTPAAAILWLGLVTVTILAQLTGHGDFLRALNGRGVRVAL